MRKLPTPQDRLLWANRLRGLSFRPQHAVGQFTLDFYCPSARSAVEVDGPVHDDRVECDQCLAGRGIRVLRLINVQVEADLSAVSESIARAAKAGS